MGRKPNPPPLSETSRSRFRHVIRVLGLSQARFAAKFEVGTTYINRILQGKVGVPSLTAWAFYGFLGSDFWEYIRDEKQAVPARLVELLQKPAAGP